MGRGWLLDLDLPLDDLLLLKKRKGNGLMLLHDVLDEERDED
jgi:hypothetical protein